MSLRHLAKAVFGRSWQKRAVCIMQSEFTCHWDESGSDPGTGTRSKSDGKSLLVGGYLAHADEWLTFDERWKEVLYAYGLEDFHMADFANNNSPFRAWDDGRCDSLISSLLDVIADCPRFYIVNQIKIDDYMEVVKGPNLLDTDIVRAYHICARKCMEQISDLARLAGHKTRILHVFDRGNSAWKSFEDSFSDAMLDSLNILAPIAQSRRVVIGLQAADVLAHQTNRHLAILAGDAAATKRIYIDRLYGKPGLVHCIGLQELKRLYREEKMLDTFRGRGKYPPRIFKTIPTNDHRRIAELLFGEAGTYEINRAVRELQ